MAILYYITRSYTPDTSGSTLMRVRAVELFEKAGFRVVVITPHYQNSEVKIQGNIVYIPLTFNIRMARILERIGWYEDYLDRWIAQAFEYLKERVKKEDILFSVSGGELGTTKLASLVKEKVGCRYVANLRDPLYYGTINGIKIDRKFHVKRENQEERYLRNADLIITASEFHRAALQKKYPQFKEKIKNNYFGYIKKSFLKSKRQSNKLRIAYAGAFTAMRAPELLARVASAFLNVEVYFIGVHHSYSFDASYLKRVHLISALPHAACIDFMAENIDVGFVSLANEYFASCVPSKIYEYINLGLPILGALPNGDAMEIVNQRGYGIACRYDDLACLNNAVTSFQNRDILQGFRDNIMRERDTWAMEEKIKEVIVWLNAL